MSPMNFYFLLGYTYCVCLPNYVDPDPFGAGSESEAD
jgi:hypothetical protein